MVRREIKLGAGSGMQAKSAAEFIHQAQNFKSSIWVEKDEKIANAKSLLGLLTLGISSGSEIKLIAQGDDEEQAIETLGDYIAQSM